jgi:hypothetical protein
VWWAWRLLSFAFLFFCLPLIDAMNRKQVAVPAF